MISKIIKNFSTKSCFSITSKACLVIINILIFPTLVKFVCAGVSFRANDFILILQNMS